MVTKMESIFVLNPSKYIDKISNKSLLFAKYLQFIRTQFLGFFTKWPYTLKVYDL